MYASLTVFFDDPFWVCVYERVSDGKLEVCKTVFGSEPKDYYVYEFFLKNWNSLKFSPPVAVDSDKRHAAGPKRLQREAGRQMARTGVGTKAQQALKMQHELLKKKKKAEHSKKNEREKQWLFEIKQIHRKQKHKGR